MSDHPVTGRFSMVRGGPMHALQRRMGVLGPDELPALRAGAAFAALAWLPLALLALFDERSWTIHYGSSFFADFGSYARNLVGIFALISVDRTADLRLSRLLQGFVASGVVSPADRPGFARALDQADRRTSSGAAEAACLLIAYGLSAAAISRAIALDANLWLRDPGGGLSAGGWWTLLVSSPLYYFLLLRWLWRFGVWALLLRRVAKLDLILVPTHPDRAGGIGFLTLFPMIFIPFAFVLSLVVASSALQEVVFGSVSFEILRYAALIWVGFVVVLLIGPLAVFSGRLLTLRETALIEYSEMVSRHNRAAEQRLRANDREDQPLDVDTISGLSDIGAGLATINGIKVLPVDLWAIVPLIIAAILPWVAVAAVEVPIVEMVQRLAGALLQITGCWVGGGSPEGRGGNLEPTGGSRPARPP